MNTSDARSVATTSSRIENLRGQMANFANDVQADREKRRREHLEALTRAGEEVVMMEHHVATEARRREEGEHALKEYLEAAFSASATALEKALDYRLNVIESNFELVQSKVSSLEQSLEKQRSKDEKLALDLRAVTGQLTTKLRDEVGAEKASRLRFEADLVTAMRQEVEKFTERLHIESLAREKVEVTLKDALRRLSQWSDRAANDAKRAELVAHVDDLKMNLQTQISERTASHGNLEELMRDLVTQVDVSVRSTAAKRASRRIRR